MIIFAENRSFDGLFGTFPGANGLGNAVSPERRAQAARRRAGSSTLAYIPQKDRDGTTVLPKLPQDLGRRHRGGKPHCGDPGADGQHAERPFPIETTFMTFNGAPL